MIETNPRWITDRRKSQTAPASTSRERLGRAVICQTVKDIVENNRKYVDFYDENWGSTRCVDHALWFIQDEGVDIGSYTWYCSLVGIDPELIRGALNRGDWDLLKQIAKIPLH